MQKSELDELNEMAKEGLAFMQTKEENIDQINENIHKSIDENIKVNGDSIGKIVKALLAVVFLILLFVLASQFLGKDKPSSPIMIAEYYEAPLFMDNGITRGTNNSEKQLAALSKAYSGQDYKAVLANLKNMQEGPLMIYKGIAQYETKDYNSAITSFQSALNTEYKDLAQWHLALTFLKMDSVKEAKDMLHLISQTEDHFKKGNANEILARLES